MYGSVRPPKEGEKYFALLKVETINGKSNTLGTYEVFFGDYKKMFSAPENYNKVTVKDIQDVAKKYFSKSNRTVGVLKSNVEN